MPDQETVTPAEAEEVDEDAEQEAQVPPPNLDWESQDFSRLGKRPDQPVKVHGVWFLIGENRNIKSAAVGMSEPTPKNVFAMFRAHVRKPEMTHQRFNAMGGGARMKLWAEITGYLGLEADFLPPAETFEGAVENQPESGS